MERLALYGDRPGRVGNKAAVLGRLRTAGLPVPDGFVITTDAYREFLEANGLSTHLRGMLAVLDRDPDADPVALEGELESLEATLALPPGLRQEVLPATLDLLARYGRVAVRSSAEAEDGLEGSLAGVYQSETGLATGDEVEAAIIRIWLASLRPHVLAALLRLDLDPAVVGVALVVQEFVAVDTFAVCFSTDPRRPGTGPLVEAVAGAGEGLMRGGKAPDVELAPEVRVRVLEAEARAREVLGLPVDVELGLAGSRLVLFQARPVVLAAHMRSDIRWGRSVTRERYPEPMSPLAISNIEAVFGDAIEALCEVVGIPGGGDRPIACCIDHRIHADEDLFAGLARVRPPLDVAGWLDLGARLARRLVERSSPLGDLSEVMAWLRLPEADRPRFGTSPEGFPAELAAWYLAVWVVRTEAARLGDWEAVKAAYRDRVAGIEARLPEVTEVVELRRLEREMRSALSGFLRPDLVIFALREASLTGIEGLARLAGWEGTREELAAAYGVGFVNPTLALGAAVRSLAARRAAAGPDDPGYRAERDAFLAEHGHLATSWDLRRPLLGEDPDAFEALLAGASTGAPEAEHRASGGAALRAIHDAVEKCVMKWPGLVAPYRVLAECLARLLTRDEEHHLLTSRVMRPGRALVARVAALLVERGVVEAAEDVWFLRDVEIWRILGSEDRRSRRFLVAGRRRGLARAEAVGETGSALGCEPGARAAFRAKAWRGQPGSTGTGTGPTRRIRSLGDASRVVEGEVLLVRTPDPVWSIVYPRAAALVSETGGILSHGVVAAREYGLPAVVGADGCFDGLPDGTRVRVDGSRGVVEVLGSGEDAS